MKITNYKACKTIHQKALGVMFKKNITKPYIFFNNKEEIIPLHMFFVFFPIDVLFLNKDKEVVEIKENFKPFTFYTPKAKASYVIELKKGKVKEKNIKLKEKIYF